MTYEQQRVFSEDRVKNKLPFTTEEFSWIWFGVQVPQINLDELGFDLRKNYYEQDKLYKKYK